MINIFCLGLVKLTHSQAFKTPCLAPIYVSQTLRQMQLKFWVQKLENHCWAPLNPEKRERSLSRDNCQRLGRRLHENLCVGPLQVMATYLKKMHCFIFIYHLTSFGRKPLNFEACSGAFCSVAVSNMAAMKKTLGWLGFTYSSGYEDQMHHTMKYIC